MENWLSLSLQIIPAVTVLIVYFVRLETRITKITTDLNWVKKQLSRRAVDTRESRDKIAN